MTLPLPNPATPVAEGSLRPLGREFARWLREVLLLNTPQRLKPTEVQTDDYSARAWDEVYADPTGGGFTVTLPKGPEDGTEVGYVNYSGSTNTVTFEADTGDTVQRVASVTNTNADGTELFRFNAAERNWSRRT